MEFLRVGPVLAKGPPALLPRLGEDRRD